MQDSPSIFRFSIGELLLCILLAAIILVLLKYPSQLARVITAIVIASSISIALLSSGGRRTFWTTFAAFSATLLVLAGDMLPYDFSEPVWRLMHDPDGVESSDQGRYYMFHQTLGYIALLVAALFAGVVALQMWQRRHRNGG